MARAVEGVRNQRSIPRPCVRICVTGELRDVKVGGGDDRAGVVCMRAGGEDAAAIELRDFGAQLFVDVAVVLFGPDLPIGARSSDVYVGPAADDQILSVRRDFAEPRAHADPVANRARLAGSTRTEVESDRAIDRPLLDRVAAEHAVLGVDPGAGEPISLLSVGPGGDPELGTRDRKSTRLNSSHPS